MEFSHIPVLADECIKALCIKHDGLYVDATVGGGGHSRLIAQRLTSGRLICLDRDSDALTAASKRLGEYADKITFVKANFSEIKSVAEGLGIKEVDGLLFDFGVSSFQLDSAERGFSYMQDASLDMRMDQSAALTAEDVVNNYPREELARIIRDFGEDRYAAKIASAIVRQRERGRIERTLELAEIIKSAMPAAAKKEKQHPAKRTFQAIRIEVNGELEAVSRGLEDGLELLAPRGRAAVISFHSLEDRAVKQIFARWARGCTCPKDFPVCVCGKKPRLRLVSKGAIVAGEGELGLNPRSRSAKLRVGEKI